MPRPRRLRLAVALIALIMLAATLANAILEPERPWYAGVRGLGVALVLSLGLWDRRGWAWWLALPWFALVAAVFAMRSTEPHDVAGLVWVEAGVSALAVVGFWTVLGGRDELDGSPDGVTPGDTIDADDMPEIRT